jgi:hypothetical protein
MNFCFSLPVPVPVPKIVLALKTFKTRTTILAIPLLLRQRTQKSQIPDPNPPKSKTGTMTGMEGTNDDPRQPLLGSTTASTKEEPEQQALSERHATSSTSQTASNVDEAEADPKDEMENLSKKSQWIVLAVASGGCAAFNGVFAKLYVIFSFVSRDLRILLFFCFLRNMRIYYFEVLISDNEFTLCFGTCKTGHVLHW